jgi:hypothetical protein
VLGQELRTLAAEHGLVILGHRGRNLTLPNSPAADQLLLGAVRTAAELSGHPELPTAPMLVYGLGPGGPEAFGFTDRNSERVAGLFLKVPLRASLASGTALSVPTYIVLAELDAFVDNAAVTAAFEAHRRAGAPWALAMEQGMIHHSLSPIQREVTIRWMRTILKLRLPRGRAETLREIDETSGWLGDRVTGEAWDWTKYPGDRALASWLPSHPTAKQWEDLVAR